MKLAPGAPTRPECSALDDSDDLGVRPGPARSGHAARLLESDDLMQDRDTARRNETDDAETASAEMRMRLALEDAKGGAGEVAI